MIVSLFRKVLGKIYPAIGWRKLYMYYKLRLVRLSATPHAIALGFAIGGFVSTTPFLGLHLVLTVVIAWLARSSIIASLISGTVVGNIFIVPFYWYISYHIGMRLMGRHVPSSGGDEAASLEKLSLRHLLDSDVGVFLQGVFLPTLIGSIILGLLLGIVCYIPVYWLVGAYQRRRQLKIQNRNGNKKGHDDA